MEFVFIKQDYYWSKLAYEEHGFESFSLDQWNQIKIRILHEDETVEAAWVYVSEENKKIYDAGEVTNYIIPCVLRNYSHNFPIGAYIPLKLDGSSRPTAKLKGWIGGCYCHKEEEDRIRQMIYNRGLEDGKCRPTG